DGDAADGDRAERVAVIGVLEVDEAPLLGAAGELPVLEGELEGDLHRGGAVVGVEDALEAGRGELGQPGGELGGGGVGQAEQGGVGEAVELVADGLVDLGAVVAVDGDPEGGDAVEVAAALGVDEVVAVAALDDEGGGIEPVAHGGEGMPEEALVEVNPAVGGHGGRLYMTGGG